MEFEVKLPQWGMAMSEGTVIQWLVTPGDAVTEGQDLVEVEAAKTTQMVTAAVAGTMGEIRVEEGTTVPPNVVLCVIATDLEVPDAEGDRPATAAEGGDVTPVDTEVPQDAPVAAGESSGDASPPGEAADIKPTDVPVATGAPVVPAGGRRRQVVPLARKLAREAGISLDDITGTGTGGRIVVTDVQAAIAARADAAARPAQKAEPEQSAAPAPAAAPSTTSRPAGSPSGSVSRSTRRRLIAQRMVQSLQSTAQLTITSTADVTDVTAFRAASPNPKPSYTDFVVRAVALALREHPHINVQFADSAVVPVDGIHVGVAVAADDGLIVPVVRDADLLGLAQLAAVTRDLTDKARRGDLSIEDVSGGTFTVTSLGGQGIDAFTPIINPPESAIPASVARGTSPPASATAWSGAKNSPSR